MSSRVFEIVELNDGEYILQRTEGDDEPLVRIKFSAEASDFLNEALTGIAKTMIEAGLSEVEYLVEDELSRYPDQHSKPDSKTLH